MKKFLTLALALVMVLALAVPAMAFTGTTSATAGLSPTLSIYLVDYTNAGFFGVVAMPAADRGYAKNEVVAAVVELKVPDGYTGNVLTGYSNLVLSGTNVTLNVTDSYQTTWTTGGIAQSGAGVVDTNGKISIAPPAGGWADNSTHKVLFFAKITADAAKLTATLAEAGSSVDFGTPFTLSGITYTVAKVAPGYTITVSAGSTSYNGAVISLAVDSNNKTIGMAINPNVTGYTTSRTIGVTVGGVLGFIDPLTSTVVTSGTEYTAIMNVYNDIVKAVFGLDYFKIGNYLYDSFFTGLTSPKTITASVDIKPWTAYVTVPSEVVVTPPKTGDAAGIMGFVMIVLAAAAAVVVKKVRA